MHSQQQKEVPAAGSEEKTEQCTEGLGETLAFRVVILAENLAVELWAFTARQSLTVPGRGPGTPAGASASRSGVQSSAQQPVNLRLGGRKGMVP